MEWTDWQDLPLEHISADLGMGAQGPPFPQIFIATSPAALSNAVSDALSIGVRVPDLGIATYLAVCMGIRPSGGFAVAIESAHLKGNQVTVHLVLQELGEDEIALQAITSPIALGIIRDLDPQAKTFSFEAKLDWEVVHVGD
jgi:hypothetical protein